MFGFLKRAFSSTGESSYIEGFHLDTAVKLPQKIETPGGSKIAVILPMVDVWYSIDGQTIKVRKVRLSKAGGMLGHLRMNMASKRGEAFYAQGVCGESALREAVEKELVKDNSGLKRKMFGKWKAQHPK
jgi:hypothetical protein